MIDYGEVGVPEEVGNTEIAVVGCPAMGLNQMLQVMHCLEFYIQYAASTVAAGFMRDRLCINRTSFICIRMLAPAMPCHACVS